MYFTWRHRVLHGTVRKSGRIIKTRCIGSTSNLLKRKDLSFSYTIERNHPLRHIPSLLFPEGYHDGCRRSRKRESICVTSTSSEDFFLDNWVKELGSEVAGGSEDSRQTQPKTKNPIVRTGRPVNSCVPVSVESLDQDKDADENVDADQIRTGWTC